MALKVSDIADRGGVSADTVRFYEREGLLPPPPRSPAGYREYDETSVHRIRFIKDAQGLGLRLAEIKELLEIQDRGACPCGHTRTLVEKHLGEIDAEMKRLSELRAELEAMSELECSVPPDGVPWACEVQFTKKGGAP